MWRRSWLPCCVAAAAAVVPACRISSPWPSSNRARTPLGSFSISGPTFGQQTLQATSCAVGEHQVFLGFDLSDETTRIVTRLVVDPATGPVVRVFRASAPFDATVLFHRSDCRVFRFSIDSTGWRIDHVEQLEVSLDLECQLPTGDAIAGQARDPGCS